MAPRPLRVLLLEDCEDDARLILHELRRAGFEPIAARVETEPEFLAHLETVPDVVVADYHQPRFDALRALRLVHERGLGVPVIVVTGALGDEAAVECLKQGACDFLLKDRMARLGQAVTQALDATAARAHRQRAEQALRDSEARKTAMFETALDGIITIDHQGRILEFNPAAEAVFGYARDKAMGQPLADLLVPSTRRQRFHQGLERCVTNGEGTPLGRRIELTAMRAGGALFPVELAFTRIHADGPPIFTGYVRDITDRKKAERQVRQLKQDLERRVAERTAELEAANAAIVASSIELKIARDQALASTDAKAAFLANISHEVRTPMVAVLGYADMLLNPRLNRADRDHALQAIRRNGAHLLQVINDVLDLTKIEVGRMELESIQYSPWQLLLEVVSTMRLAADEKSIVLDARAMGRLPAAAVMDPTRVRQILMNLVSNAIKFSGQGARVSLRIEVRPTGPSRSLCLAIDVEDQGIGMTPAQIDQLFTPFQQADTSTTRKFGGSGLGLSITRRLLEAMGGVITVRSLYGRGSCFCVSIPLGLIDENVMWFGVDELRSQAAPENDSEGPVELPTISGRVLLAEDCLDNQRVLVHYLSRMGLETEVVGNGRLAIEKALGGGFDLILMDIQMPELDGYCATSSLRRSGYHGPIIALTAHAMVEDRDKCLRAGCSDYLTKPVEGRALALTIAKHMRAHRAFFRSEGQCRTIETTADEYAIVSGFQDSPGMEALIRDYVECLADKVACLRSLAAAGEVRELEALAHQIKGHGAMYGFPCLTETADLIEQAGHEAQGAELVAELIEEFAVLASRIDAGLALHSRGARR